MVFWFERFCTFAYTKLKPKKMMMSKITKFLTVAVLLFFGANIVNAQCEPDPNCVDPEGDGQFCPTVFTPAIEDEYYEEVLTIIIPAEMQGVDIHHIDLLSIDNIPPGMAFECQDNDCSLWPQIPKCIKISGTPEIDSWGDYKLYLKLEVFIDIAGIAISMGEMQDSSSVVTIESQLHADFEISYGMSNTICNNSETTITYTGDDIDADSYHWDFGDNMTVISGDGVGPYVVIYDNEYFGLDSVSLFIQKEPYTSPTVIETFMVDYCLSVSSLADASLYSFYPNPMGDILNLNSNDFSSATISIFDLRGKEIIRSNVNKGDNIIDVSALRKGVYFLNIISPEAIITHKIIKK